MKKILYTSYLLVLTEVVAVAQNRFPEYEAYIANYSQIAIEEMQEYGIPASITLAQGILESGAGKSPLAVEGNNHFGIKCHSEWTGEKIYHDDDEIQECFRKYTYVKESYEDHSKFLTSRERYASLFLLEKTDYKGWARGLKAAGYATDLSYPERLIKIIEDYELYKYDNPSSTKPKSTYLTEEKQENIPPKTNTTTKTVTYTNQSQKTDTIDRAKKVYFSDKIIGQVSPYSSHEVKEINGVKYVKALQNDSYESIAEEFALKVREIYAINDAMPGDKLEVGDIVYIRAKKTEGTISFHVVKPDETMREIAQKYGIKLSVLYKKNNMLEGVKPMIGQRLILK